ncbi:MAG: phosphodiester glycosidase family protein [Deltaproteobacteria bacterium]|nr:phosphodiester glycosidase family protein [Deltaproteobacteria bacterium]
MFRFFCQILYFAALPLTLLSGCIALAAGPPEGPGDFPPDGLLRSQIWQLAAWLSPASGDRGGLVWREALVPQEAGRPPLRLAMAFADDLSAWPMAIEAECRLDGPGDDGRVGFLRDARPFGQGNLSLDSAGPAELRGGARIMEGCLGRAIDGLSLGPYLEPFEWELLEPGLWRARTRANYGPRLGPRDVFLVRASPDFFRLAPYHESEEGPWRERPGDIRAWARRLPGAPVLVNSGQYFPDRSYMGLLRRQGKDIGSRAHGAYRGFWVQDPSLGADPGRPRATLLDREMVPEDDPGQEGYGTVIQSFMVLDRLGRTRVKRSERLASRAVLGLDRQGRAVVVLVKGAIALSDLAVLAQKMGLVSALGLDGGLETQMALNLPQGLEIQAGRYSHSFLGSFLAEELGQTLPSVIAFERLAPLEAPAEGDGPTGPGGPGEDPQGSAE